MRRGTLVRGAQVEDGTLIGSSATNSRAARDLRERVLASQGEHLR
jgi:hypothetical protein